MSFWGDLRKAWVDGWTSGQDKPVEVSPASGPTGEPKAPVTGEGLVVQQIVVTRRLTAEGACLDDVRILHEYSLSDVFGMLETAKFAVLDSTQDD